MKRWMIALLAGAALAGSAAAAVAEGDDASLDERLADAQRRLEDAAREGEAPVLVTSPSVRPFVRGIVERFRTQTSVLSQSEIHPRVRLKTVGAI